jgi:hypothetical protein
MRDASPERDENGGRIYKRLERDLERESMSMSERQWSKRDGGRKEMVDRVRESQRENMSYFCRIFGVHISYLL